MAMTQEFKTAELYTCSEDKPLMHSTVEDAVQEYLDDQWDAEEPVEAQCDRIGPLDVFAYNTDKVDPTWVEKKVEQFMIDFRDSFEEAYGSEDFAGEPWNKDTEDWAKKVIHSNLVKSLRQAKVYTCHQVGTHTFTSDELKELLK